MVDRHIVIRKREHGTYNSVIPGSFDPLLISFRHLREVQIDLMKFMSVFLKIVKKKVRLV